MPRRQRFKPSRKPKPAIEPTESDVMIQPTKAVDQATEQLQPPDDDRISR